MVSTPRKLKTIWEETDWDLAKNAKAHKGKVRLFDRFTLIYK